MAIGDRYLREHEMPHGHHVNGTPSEQNELPKHLARAWFVELIFFVVSRRRQICYYNSNIFLEKKSGWLLGSPTLRFAPGRRALSSYRDIGHVQLSSLLFHADDLFPTSICTLNPITQEDWMEYYIITKTNTPNVWLIECPCHKKTPSRHYCTDWMMLSFSQEEKKTHVFDTMMLYYTAYSCRIKNYQYLNQQYFPTWSSPHTQK